jgi:hypothetical protein
MGCDSDIDVLEATSAGCSSLGSATAAAAAYLKVGGGAGTSTGAGADALGTIIGFDGDGAAFGTFSSFLDGFLDADEVALLFLGGVAGTFSIESTDVFFSSVFYIKEIDTSIVGGVGSSPSESSLAPIPYISASSNFKSS